MTKALSHKKIIVYTFLALIVSGLFLSPLSIALDTDTLQVSTALAETKDQAVARAKAADDQATAALATANQRLQAAQMAVNSCITSLFCSKEKTELANAQRGYDLSLNHKNTADQAYQAALNAPDSDTATQAANNAASQADKGAATANGSKDQLSSCADFTSLDIGGCLDIIAASISQMLLRVASWLLTLAGRLLDYVLQYTVVDMKANLGGIAAINSGWVIFRDLGNFFFIFILIYIAVKTMLGMDSGQTKRMLINVVVIGLLVNFSLFFTKFLIDISNILSVAFYHKMDPTGQGISSTFMGSFSLTGIFNPDAFFQTVLQGDKTLGAIFMVGVGGSIFVVVAAFAFFYAAALFIIRYITIIFLIVLSPLPFFAAILPGTRNYAKKWWHALVGQIAFAPLYLLLLYMALGFSNAITQNAANATTTSTGGIASAINMDPTAIKNHQQTGIDATFNYVLLIGFIIAGSVLATKVSSYSGGVIEKAVKGVSDRISPTKMAREIGGAVGSNTIGRAAKGAGWLYDRGEILAKNNRVLSPLRTIAKGANIATLGIAGGVAGSVNRSVRGSIKEVEESKFGSGENLAARKKYYDTHDKFLSELQKKDAEIAATKKGAKDGATPEQIREMEEALNNMSNKRLEEILEKLNIGILTHPNFVRSLSAQQVETIDKSDKVSDGDKGRILEARFRPLTTALNTSQAASFGPVRDLKDKEIELLDPSVLTNPNFVNNLKTSQYDAIMKSSKFTKTQRDQIRTNRTAPLLAAIAVLVSPASVTEIQTRLRNLGAGEVSKLPEAVLRDPDLMPHLNGKMLEKIAEEQAANTTLLTTIGAHVRGPAGAPNTAHPAHKWINGAVGTGLFP